MRDDLLGSFSPVLFVFETLCGFAVLAEAMDLYVWGCG